MSTRQGYRLWPLLVAVLSLLAAAGLALHHPLLPALTLAAAALLVAAATRWPGSWPLWVLPLLPVAGLYTWTGWLVAEEFDVVVLATVAGLYLHAGLKPAEQRTPVNWVGALALGLYGACLAVSAARGWAGASTSTAPAWWQGYHEPWNAVRVAKSTLWALLLLPPSLRALSSDAHAFSRHLVQGMAAMLGVVALLALWERWAFTGLLNFSTDYRTTALFWEMHVGGAALDSVLALSVAFAGAALVSADRTREWAAWLAVAALGAYACVTTFSRIVYLAAPFALGLWLLWRRQSACAMEAPRRPLPAGSWALPVAFLGGSLWLFPAAGYRGLLAWWMACAALPYAMSCARRLSARHLALATGIGALLAAASTPLLQVPKAPYVVHGAAAVLLLGHAWLARKTPPSDASGTGALALWLVLAAGVATVSVHWGGSKALWPGAGLAGLLATVPWLLRLWPRHSPAATARSQAVTAAVMAMLTLLVGVSGGGAYMGNRFDSTRHDLDDRLAHWRLSLNALQSPTDWLLGAGTGRYPSMYMQSARIQDIPGDYRWLADEQGARLLLTGGRHVMGWGEVLRVSQRIQVPAAPAQVRVRIRAPQAVTVHAEVCEKHLLYNGRCAIGKWQLQPSGAEWKDIALKLDGEWPLRRGSSLAPRLMVFSLALGSPGTRAEVARVELLDSTGAPLLDNVDFTSGLQAWYISSDRNHMPWHAKNLALHLLAEQGALGLMLWAGLAAAAVLRLTRSSLATLPFAAASAAGLCGLLVVGIADSLLDIPRLSFLLHFFIALGVTGVAGTLTLQRTAYRPTAPPRQLPS